jgi:hypothetical protein
MTMRQSKKSILKKSLFRFRQPEQLETRDMLSGHGFAGGFERFSAAATLASQQTAAAQIHVNTEMATVLARQDVFAALGSFSSLSQKTVLTASLSDPNSSATGTVTYKTGVEDGVTETEFKVSIKGAAADTTLDVSIGDVVVGQITTDANGNGTLKLSSNPDDSSEQTLPANFPTDVAAGATITAGTLSGTLAVPTGHGGCQGEFDGTRLSASLSDTETGATATVTFKTYTKDSTTTTRLAATVKGATANSTLDVTIDGVVVGQVTTDASGAGSLVLSSNPTGDEQPLPANFPATIADGSTVSVGTMSGTLGTVNSEHASFARFGRRR